MYKIKCNKILTKTQKKLKFLGECAVLDITDNRKTKTINVEKGREKNKRSK